MRNVGVLPGEHVGHCQYRSTLYDCKFVAVRLVGASGHGAASATEAERKTTNAMNNARFMFHPMNGSDWMISVTRSMMPQRENKNLIIVIETMMTNAARNQAARFRIHEKS